jgi:hypothetical protein
MLTREQVMKAIAFNDTHPLPVAYWPLVLAAWQDQEGLVVDGMLGPKTMESLVKATKSLAPVTILPTTPEELEMVYGKPGAEDTKWYKQNIMEVRDFPGVPMKWYVQVHRKAEPFFRAGLDRACRLSRYRIKRVGGFNYRLRTSGSGKLSIHASGAALDIDADTNKATRFQDGYNPGPWSPEWMDIWPRGLPKDFVLAMESAGLTWGGRFSTYVDPMHFQAAGPLA